MDSNLQKNLQTSIRKRYTATFVAGGLSTNIVTAPPGYSFVAVEIITALVASTNLTFKGRCGDDPSGTAATAAQLALIKQENGDGSAAADYTVTPSNTVGVYPLRSIEFHPVQHLQVISDQAGNATKSVTLIAKPV